MTTLSEDAVRAASLIDGWMNLAELRELADLAATRRTIVEVGSWKGRSTKALALSTPGYVYAVDTWAGSPDELGDAHKEAATLGPDGLYRVFCDNLAPEIALDKVRPIRRSSLDAAMMWCDPPDLIFLDGDHAYESVKVDLEAWTAVAAPGALLVGHDYSWPGVSRAVHERYEWVTRLAGDLWSVSFEPIEPRKG